MATGSGGFGGCSTWRWVVPACGAAAVIPTRCCRATALDFWRVEEVEPGRLLRLAAEMRLPGRAWLQFEVTPEAGGSLIRQTAMFDPVGVAGLLYWYGLWWVHQLVFAGMLRNIVRAASAPA